MKHLVLIILIISFSSCKNNKDTQSYIVDNGSGYPNLDSLELDFNNWWTYHENNISLALDFIAINDKSEQITKDEFFMALTSGEFIPYKLDTNDSLVNYKLFKLTKSANQGIRSTIKNTTKTSYNHFKLEGESFPEFDFTDLNGNHYTKNNTKDKTIILKCWFINCEPCVAEFPELNALVERNTHRNDILFISLALDSKSELEKFLNKKHFAYQVVSEQKTFIYDKLEVNIFPTHYIIEPNGLIKKVFNKSTELISFLENKKIILAEGNKIVPPPPAPASPSPM